MFYKIYKKEIKKMNKNDILNNNGTKLNLSAKDLLSIPCNDLIKLESQRISNIQNGWRN